SGGSRHLYLQETHRFVGILQNGAQAGRWIRQSARPLAGNARGMHSPSTAEAPVHHEMGLVNRIANLIGVAVPPIGVAVAAVLLWQRAVDGFDLGLLAATYLITGFGVTVGYHRLLTH